MALSGPSTTDKCERVQDNGADWNVTFNCLLFVMTLAVSLAAIDRMQTGMLPIGTLQWITGHWGPIEDEAGLLVTMRPSAN